MVVSFDEDSTLASEEKGEAERIRIDGGSAAEEQSGRRKKGAAESKQDDGLVQDAAASALARPSSGFGLNLTKLVRKARATSSRLQAIKRRNALQVMKNWTVEDVVTWAKDEGDLPWDEAEKLKAEGITGDVLKCIGMDDLRQIGIATVGRRRKLLNAIEAQLMHDKTRAARAAHKSQSAKVDDEEDEELEQPTSSMIDKGIAPRTLSSRKKKQIMYAEIGVLHLFSASEMSESFKVEMSIRLRWRSFNQDQTDQNIMDGLDRLDTEWEPAWCPRFMIKHKLAVIVEPVAHFFAEVVVDDDHTDSNSDQSTRASLDRGSGLLKDAKNKTNEEEVWIEGEWRVVVAIRGGFDLRDYPFDFQDCNIDIKLDNVGANVQLKPFPKKQQYHKSKAEKKEHNITKSHASRRRKSSFSAEPGAARLDSPNKKRGKDQNELTGRRASLAMGTAAGMGKRKNENPLKIVMMDVDGIKLPNLELFRENPVVYTVTGCSVHIAVMYRRKFAFFFWNFYMLMMATGCVMICVWCIDPDDPGSRLEITVTVFLVAVAFKQGVTAMVPPVAYLTRLDKYVVWTIFYLFAAIIFHTGVSLLPTGGDETSLMYSVDRTLFYIYASGWCLFNMGYLAQCLKTQSETYIHLMEELGDQSHHWECARPMHDEDEGDMSHRTQKHRKGSKMYVPSLQEAKSEKLKVKRAESQKMLSLKKQAQADNERFKATRGSGVFGDE